MGRVHKAGNRTILFKVKKSASLSSLNFSSDVERWDESLIACFWLPGGRGQQFPPSSLSPSFVFLSALSCSSPLLAPRALSCVL